MTEHGDPRDPLTVARYLRSIVDLKAATRLRYLSHVEVAHLRLYGARPPREAAMIADIRETLKRGLVGDAPNQAPPATTADVLRAYSMDPDGLGAVAVVQYATATRFGDLQGVVSADATIDGNIITISLRRTKTTLTSGTRAVLVRLPSHTVATVRALLEREQPFKCEYGAYLGLLRRVHKGLSAHSLRRGAIQQAMRSAQDAQVMRLTGHRSLETLARYAGVLPQTWKLEMIAAADAIWK